MQRASLAGLVALLGFAIVLVSSAPSAAQVGTLDLYRASETTEGAFHLSRASDLGHLRFGIQLHANYAANPLVYEARLGTGVTEQFSIVSDQLVSNLGLAFGLFERLVIFAGVPIVLLMDGDATATSITGVLPADGSGFSDIYLGGRVRIFGEEEDAFALGASATLTFPSSGASSYRGDQSLSLLVEAQGEIRPGFGISILLNVGALIRDEGFQPASNVVFSHELRLGAGIVVPVWTDEGHDGTHIDLGAQIFVATAFRDFFGRESTPSEALGTAQFHHESGIVIGLAAGPGMTPGIGSPDLRVVGQVGWTTPEEPEIVEPEHCPAGPEDIDGFEDDDQCVDPDNDQDGILDSVDACPNEPENVNEYEDTDGCPDEIPDTDSDGLLDTVDECPTDPEDIDEFEDENGCPDPDNDRDGVLDSADECPLEVGPEENDGCPDPDRDTDTVVDRIDNCPDVIGPPENQGCPEAQRVVITGTQIQILDRVFFGTDRDMIQRRSFSLLDNVAAALNAHPEIEHIRVEGHTDSRGTREHNLDLSQRRAQAVVTYLVDRREVAAERLSAQGFGPDRRQVENATTPEEHAQNRRVEFNIPEETVRGQQSGTSTTEDTVDSDDDA